MITEWLESNIIQVVTLIAGIVYFASKVETSSKASKEFLEAELKHVTNLISLNHQNLREEISRLKEKHADNMRELKEDINRLEAKQNESNCIKERLAINEERCKSLHKRLDELSDDLCGTDFMKQD